MPVFTNDDSPLKRSGAPGIKNFTVVQKSNDSLLERGIATRTGKVRFQSVPLQDDAGRTLLHEKIRHGVKFRRADFERQMKPRFLHKVLCHSPTK